MAPKTLTDYERLRLENIRRNKEVMSALMLQRKATDLLKPAPAKKPKPESEPEPKLGSPKREPIVLRRSDRTRGTPPSSFSTETPPTPPPPPAKRDPLPITDAFRGRAGESDSDFLLAIRSAGAGSDFAKGEGFDPRRGLVLRPENVEKVVPWRIYSVRFLPAADQAVVIVGSKNGNLGFWDGDRVYVYEPHTGPVSEISVHPFSLGKIFTSSYDGHIRLMDIEKGTFNVVCSSDYLFFSICQWPLDINSLYMGEGPGFVKAWDEREGKASSEWELHADRINTIDFNPEDRNLMATSSTDGTACIWDLRSIRKDRPESLQSVRHQRAVHSAYFSPNGSRFATTSIDNKVGILSGANFANLSMIPHENHTNRWLSSFRAIWGWDDSYLFLGNMKRAVDVISTDDGTTMALQSPHMTSIPCRFATHPYRLGHLAGATAGGKVFLWTKE